MGVDRRHHPGGGEGGNDNKPPLLSHDQRGEERRGTAPHPHLPRVAAPGARSTRMCRRTALCALSVYAVSYTHLDVYKRQDVGSAFPKVNLGVSLGAEWKGLDLNMFFDGNFGNKIYNAQYYTTVYNESTGNQYACLLYTAAFRWLVS